MLETFIGPQIDYLLAIQNFRVATNGIFNDFFLTATTFGEIIIPMSILSMIYWGINKKAGTLMIFTFGLSLYFNVLLKMTACIKRPWLFDSRITPLKEAMAHADGYSFPSGHTASAMGVWGTIAYYWWKNKMLRYIAITIVILVAFSRNYVGVHTPQDIIVSIISGILIIFAADKILQWIEKKSTRDVLFYMIILFLSACLYIYIDTKCDFQMLTNANQTLKINPLEVKHSVYGKLGFLTGLFTGWILERRYIKFEIPESKIIKKSITVTIGITILILLLNTLCKQIDNYLPYRYASFASRFIIALYVTAIYPIIIKFTANR